jgi:hypothetical protein
MRRGTPRRSEQNQSLDEEIGKIPEQLQSILTGEYDMDPLRANPSTSQPQPLSRAIAASKPKKDAPNTLKQPAYNNVLYFGKALNAGADTVMAQLGELGLASSATLKSIYPLAGTTASLGNAVKIEDLLRNDPTGSPPGLLSKVIRNCATIFNATTGILSVAQASAVDRMSGDTSYRRTMKAVGTSIGQMTVGVLATAAVTALAPASAPTLAVAVIGGTLITGCTIVSGKVLNYLMASYPG